MSDEVPRRSTQEPRRSRHGGLNRREALAAAAGMAAAGGVSSIAGSARAEIDARGRGFRVIDWRNRPPIEQVAGLFNLRKNFIAGRPTTLGNPATPQGQVPGIVEMVGKPGAVEAWWEVVDAAGIDAVVVNGRHVTGADDLTLGNDLLLDFQNRYPGRFYGLATLDIDQPAEKTVAELEEAIAGGLRGANLEPGYRLKNGGPTTIDDADLYPVLETMQSAGLPLQVQTGAFAGLENWGAANQMWRFDTVMNKFPKLRLVLAHGGYPEVLGALALALKHPTVTICPDVYMFWPGGQLYQQNLEMLPDQFVYGSAFPFGDMDTTLEMTLALPVGDGVMEKYLYSNAKNLLQI